MVTMRQIERYWNAKDYERLFSALVSTRVEARFHFDGETQRPALAAALAVIRLDELSQSYLPLYTRLLRALLAGQEADGGWGDAVVTAWCVRALCCNRGDGIAIDRGVEYLANLQKEEGIWPAQPLRRMPADAYVSAFLLHLLGDNLTFRHAVRFDDALAWFDSHGRWLDAATQELWEGARSRCRLPSASQPPAAQLWLHVA